MTIGKENKTYTVSEHRDFWILTLKAGELSVDFKVPKDMCPDEDALRAYVKEEPLF